ncbi:MAG TPA: acyl-CoA-binding protein [Casimicrobiaceae bacterium]
MPTAAKKGAANSAAAKAPAGDDLAARFKSAAAAAKQTKKRPDNATLLKLYAYYKQATDGDVAGARPGAFDFVAGAKFDAWSKLKGMTVTDAMANYIKLVERLNRE